MPALLLWVVYRWADGRAEPVEDAAPPPASTVAPPAQAPALNTGLLSYRRAAGRLSRDLNLGAFVAGVQPLMSMINAQSCAAISLDGRPIGEANPTTIVIPASNLKILTAAVAVETLGIEYTFTTKLSARRR